MGNVGTVRFFRRYARARNGKAGRGLIKIGNNEEFFYVTPTDLVGLKSSLQGLQLKDRDITYKKRKGENWLIGVLGLARTRRAGQKR